MVKVGEVPWLPAGGVPVTCPEPFMLSQAGALGRDQVTRLEHVLAAEL